MSGEYFNSDPLGEICRLEGDITSIVEGDTTPLEEGETTPLEEGDIIPLEEGDTIPLELVEGGTIFFKLEAEPHFEFLSGFDWISFSNKAFVSSKAWASLSESLLEDEEEERLIFRFL